VGVAVTPLVGRDVSGRAPTKKDRDLTVNAEVIACRLGATADGAEAGGCVKRKMLVAGVVSTIAIVGAAAPAVAEPPGQAKDPEAFVCDGEDVEIVTAGRNGWIDDARYKAVTFSIEGTFTPTGGTPQPVSESKTWAGGKDVNSPDLVTCTVDFSETDETGTFEAHVEITAVPVG
jgi:hypothetical protein